MNDTSYDMTNDFETLITKWQGFPPGHKVTPQDLAEMITAAEYAQSASGWMWAALGELLTEHGPFKNERVAKAEAKRCRIKADLGSVPRNTRDFVATWLRTNGYIMDFDNSFSKNGHLSHHDRDYLGKLMKLWSDEMKEFSSPAIDNAFDVWMVDTRQKIQNETYHKLKFLKDADPDQTELDRFVEMVVAEGETVKETTDIRRAAKVSFANFIFRTKNHMRGVMKSSCHMMPILTGKQGDGKSEAIKALCGPLKTMAVTNGFEAFADNSMTYQFSVMPVMIFDDMSGASKADIEKLKTVMTETNKQMREAYARAGTRRIISTFIGSSNKDISGLIKDETGNRRLIQFNSRKVDRDAVQKLDYTKIWQSIDENADEPPKFANSSDLELIEAMQEQQRFRSPVEEWIQAAKDRLAPGKKEEPDTTVQEEPDTTGKDYIDRKHRYNVNWDAPRKAREHFEYFSNFLKDYAPGEVVHWSARRLGTTLTELARAGRIDVKITRTGGSPSFQVNKPSKEAAPEEGAPGR